MTGALGGILMIVADFSPVLAIDIKLAGTCEIVAEPELRNECSPSGGSRHSYALVLLGLFALVMAWGAGLGHSRPAAVALLVAGLVVLGIAVIRDLPAIDDTGAIGLRFSEAEASPARGLWLALAGGALAVLAGALALRRDAPD